MGTQSRVGTGRSSEMLDYIGWDVTSDGCWEWRGDRNELGYGRLTLVRKGLDKARVHRIMFERYFGPIPDGSVVRHKCDNPPCCNPDHLELGTMAENMADMIERGRHRNSKKTRCKRGHSPAGPRQREAGEPRQRQAGETMPGLQEDASPLNSQLQRSRLTTRGGDSLEIHHRHPRRDRHRPRRAVPPVRPHPPRPISRRRLRPDPRRRHRITHPRKDTS